MMKTIINKCNELFHYAVHNMYNKIKQCWSNIKYVCKVHTWFDYMFENPFSIWYNKEIRQVFVLPNIKFNVHSVMYESGFTSHIFGLYTVALSWTSKYGESRYEDDPCIQLNLFGICFKLRFEAPFKDIATTESYWESILEYYNKLYEHKIPNLYKIIEKNTWINMNGEEYDTTVILTNRGYLKYLNDMQLVNKEQNVSKNK